MDSPSLKITYTVPLVGPLMISPASAEAIAGVTKPVIKEAPMLHKMVVEATNEATPL